MIKFILIMFFSCFFLCPSYAFDVIKPNVAGSFYPDDPEELKKVVDSYIDSAIISPMGEDVRLLISPHAGYKYSGSVAGYAYKAIKGKKYSTVIVIAPSHKHSFDGISVYTNGLFKTPLGELVVDSDVAGKLISSDKKIFFKPEVFKDEHALEVELPFLQRSLDNFKIVPIIFGEPSIENCKILGSALTEILKDKNDCLVVVSTDMSHYHPYDKANAMDNLTIDKIRLMDYGDLYDSVLRGDSELCGFAGVISGLIYCKNIEALKCVILKYANSGDTSGAKNAVVGYFSAVFIKDRIPEAKMNREESNLTKEQRKRLLEIARLSMESYVKDRMKPDIKEEDPALTKVQGAFVTLNENGQLRGCIGNIQGTEPLYKTVSNMAVEAATGDPRFMPVTAKELSKIHIEISVLSPLRKIDSPDEIVMGKHGVIVRRGFNSGVFLPQVATETGWSKEEFMNCLCSQKACLPENAWKDKDTNLYVFTAEVFGEDEK